MIHYTPTQQAMLDVLSDGCPHSRLELHGCLRDELGDIGNIKVHLSNLRKRLRLISEDVVCVYVRGDLRYQHIKLLVKQSVC